MRRLRGLGLLALALCPAAVWAGEPLEHVVQPGESLWQIAAQTGGDPQLWPVLYRANRDQIKDPSRLYPGGLPSPTAAASTVNEPLST